MEFPDELENPNIKNLEKSAFNLIEEQTEYDTQQFKHVTKSSKFFSTYTGAFLKQQPRNYKNQEIKDGQN